ncbi:hypothetical protein ACIQ7Q_20610 [Streptomyces sp. NPDC096176]|uniref:hypothetical protein n=1 Tax=Streptomyces sp. NPDC096176 TaxID=3366079 RepID=UPI003813A86D
MSATPGSSPPPTPPSQPPRDDYDACGGWDGTERPLALRPDGPAYAGPGPHPIMSFADSVHGELPAEWDPLAAGPVQLVLCEDPDESFKSVKIGTCAYDDGATIADVESARYIYRVYEARTAELVDTFTLQGSTSVRESCPYSALNPSLFYQLVQSKDLADKLRPLVEGARPR